GGGGGGGRGDSGRDGRDGGGYHRGSGDGMYRRSGGDEDGEGGGYRGGRREGGGGYRGRRDDDDDVDTPPLPSSWDRDVVAAFIDQIDLTKYKSVEQLRELRQYFYIGFKKLVQDGWASLEALDKEKREKEMKRIRQTAAIMDGFILEIDQTLANLQDRQEPDDETALVEWQRGVNEMYENLDEELFTVPRTPPTRRRSSRRRGNQEGDLTATASEANTSNRRRVYRSPLKPFIREVKELYMNARNRSLDSPGPANDSLVPDAPPSDESRQRVSGASRIQSALDEDFMSLRDCRQLRFPANLQVSREGTPWPDSIPQSWLIHPKPQGYGIRKHIKITPAVRRAPPPPPPQPIPVDQNQESSSVHMPRQLPSQNQEFLEGVSTNQLDSFRDEDMVLSSSRILSHSAMRASSTPLRRVNEHNRPSFIPSTIDNTDPQFSLPDGLLATPAAAPPLPAEFPSGSEVEASTLVFPADIEETAMVDPPPSSLTRSRVGVTPQSVLSFQPLLPAIHEEGFSDSIRELRSTAAASVPPPRVSSRSTLPRDWASIFRPREEVMNYEDGGTAPANQGQRRRRNRRVRGRRPPPGPTTPDLQVSPELPGSNPNVTTNFLADLLEQASEIVKAVSPEDPLAQAEPEAVRKSAHEPHQKEKSVNEASSLFPAAPPADILNSTALNIDGILPAPQDSPGLNLTPEILTTVNISNISERSLDPPALPDMAIENPSLNEVPSVTTTSLKAIVTSVEIINPPINIQQINQPDAVSDIPSGVKPTGVPSLAERRRQEVINESNQCYDYVVQNIDFFAMIIRQKKELCDQSQSSLLTGPSGKDLKRYISTPSSKFYNTQIIFNVPAKRSQLVAGVLTGLVTLPSVDIQKAPFIKSRMDAAITFRYLLDLKAKNVINLSGDGRIFSLR
ncbi:hypothetical protein KR067_001327, partial [Drosophila pandora]